jgi:flavodoxin
MTKKSLIIVYSYHHCNTLKIARAMAGILDAQVKKPQETNPEELKDYDLIGFDSGIYGSKHHESIISLVNNLSKTKKLLFFPPVEPPPLQ